MALAAKPSDLSLIPGTHVAEGEDAHVLSSDCLKSTLACEHLHTYTHVQMNKLKIVPFEASLVYKS